MVRGAGGGRRSEALAGGPGGVVPRAPAFGRSAIPRPPGGAPGWRCPAPGAGWRSTAPPCCSFPRGCAPAPRRRCGARRLRRLPERRCCGRTSRRGSRRRRGRATLRRRRGTGRGLGDGDPQILVGPAQGRPGGRGTRQDQVPDDGPILWDVNVHRAPAGRDGGRPYFAQDRALGRRGGARRGQDNEEDGCDAHGPLRKGCTSPDTSGKGLGQGWGWAGTAGSEVGAGAPILDPLGEERGGLRNHRGPSGRTYGSGVCLVAPAASSPLASPRIRP